MRVERRPPGPRLGLAGVHLGDGRVDLHDPAVVRLHAVAVDRRRDRQPVDGEVDLHARALAAVGLDGGPEPVGHRAVLHEPQEGRLRVGVREHARGADLHAAVQLDARRRARPRRGSARTGAAVRIVAPASRAASAIASVSRPIPPRTKPHWRMPPPACSEAWSWRRTNAVPGVDGPPVESLIACQPSAALTCSLAKYSARDWFAEVPNKNSASEIRPRLRAASPPRRTELRGPQPPRVRGRGVEQRHDQLRDLRELVLELGQRPRVGGREAPELVLRLRQVVVEVQRRAVREQVERRARGVDLDPALDQAQVPPHGLAQHAEHVGAGRGAKARGELLGHAAAADDLAALADHHAQAGRGEVVGGDEPVVARADDHRVVVAAAVRRAHVSSWRIRASL